MVKYNKKNKYINYGICMSMLFYILYPYISGCIIYLFGNVPVPVKKNTLLLIYLLIITGITIHTILSYFMSKKYQIEISKKIK